MKTKKVSKRKLNTNAHKKRKGKKKSSENKKILHNQEKSGNLAETPLHIFRRNRNKIHTQPNERIWNGHYRKQDSTCWTGPALTLQSGGREGFHLHTAVLPGDRSCQQHPAQAKSLRKPAAVGIVYRSQERWVVQQITQYLEDPPAPVILHTKLLLLGILSTPTAALPHLTEDVSSPRNSLSSYFLLLLALFPYICSLSLRVFCCLPTMLMFMANKRDTVQWTMCLHK